MGHWAVASSSEGYLSHVATGNTWRACYRGERKAPGLLAIAQLPQAGQEKSHFRVEELGITSFFFQNVKYDCCFFF